MRDINDRKKMGSADYHPLTRRLSGTLNASVTHNRGRDDQRMRARSQASSPQQKKAMVGTLGVFLQSRLKDRAGGELLTQPHAEEMHQFGCHSCDKATTDAKYMAQRKLLRPGNPRPRTQIPPLNEYLCYGYLCQKEGGPARVVHFTNTSAIECMRGNCLLAPKNNYTSWCD